MSTHVKLQIDKDKPESCWYVKKDTISSIVQKENDDWVVTFEGNNRPEIQLEEGKENRVSLNYATIHNHKEVIGELCSYSMNHIGT